jgi:hypothetical protein
LFDIRSCTLVRCWPVLTPSGRPGRTAPPTPGTMCGRFTQKYTWEELHRLYRLTQPARNLRPPYNICPTDPVDVIVPRDGALAVVPMRWQLIPPWWRWLALQSY